MNDQHDDSARIDEMISKIKAKLKEKEPKKQIGFWLPESKKKKFDDLQDASHQEFGRELSRYICEAIDRADLSDLEAS